MKPTRRRPISMTIVEIAVAIAIGMVRSTHGQTEGRGPRGDTTDAGHAVPTFARTPVDGIDYNIKTTCHASSSVETCFDDYDYLGEDGYSCAAWRTDDCDSADDPEDVKKHCPFACETCTPLDCEDNVDYLDPGGFPCTEWIGYECGMAAENFGFSLTQEILLLQNCPLSCKFCGDMSDNSCQFPFWANEVKQTRCMYDTSDGSEWCRTSALSPITQEPLWKICVPAGTPCQFPFVFNKTSYTTCAVDPDTNNAWCPTKLNWDGTVWDGHWTNCECDVEKDAVRISRTSTTTTTTTSTTTTTTFTSTRSSTTQTIGWYRAIDSLPDCPVDRAGQQCWDFNNFKDSDGDNCASYVDNLYCNSDGSAGSHWAEDQSFADYVNNKGFHAGNACCGCGGGDWKDVGDERTNMECRDYPASFVDADGHSCEIYTKYSYCAADGTYGVNWAAGQSYADYMNGGFTAGTACCGCGGGRWYASSFNYWYNNKDNNKDNKDNKDKDKDKDNGMGRRMSRKRKRRNYNPNNSGVTTPPVPADGVIARRAEEEEEFAAKWATWVHFRMDGSKCRPKEWSTTTTTHTSTTYTSSTTPTTTTVETTSTETTGTDTHTRGTTVHSMWNDVPTTRFYNGGNKNKNNNDNGNGNGNGNGNNSNNANKQKRTTTRSPANVNEPARGVVDITTTAAPVASTKTTRQKKVADKGLDIHSDTDASASNAALDQGSLAAIISVGAALIILGGLYAVRKRQAAYSYENLLANVAESRGLGGAAKFYDSSVADHLHPQKSYSGGGDKY